MKDALETLGTKISEGEQRDAVHVAVLPVEAAHPMHPGDHVGLLNGKASFDAKEQVGIVDPFLSSRVQPGECFWLMLYPRTITSLRHEWTHPAIAVEGEKRNPGAGLSRPSCGRSQPSDVGGAAREPF